MSLIFCLNLLKHETECLVVGPLKLYEYMKGCVRPEIMSDLLENDGALSEVGSKELCTCNKGYMAGLKEMFSLGWAYWA